MSVPLVPVMYCAAPNEGGISTEAGPPPQDSAAPGDAGSDATTD
jgi:hypothetical protein